MHTFKVYNFGVSILISCLFPSQIIFELDIWLDQKKDCKYVNLDSSYLWCEIWNKYLTF